MSFVFPMDTAGADEDLPVEHNVAAEYYVEYVRQCAAYIESEMLAGGVLPHLVAGRCITDREREDIEHEPRQYAKNERLLRLLLKKGTGAIQCLFTALHHEGQTHIVNHIIKQGEAGRRHLTNPICAFRAVGCHNTSGDAECRRQHEESSVLEHLHLLMEQFQEMKIRESAKDNLISNLKSHVARLEQEVRRTTSDFASFKSQTQDNLHALREDSKHKLEVFNCGVATVERNLDLRVNEAFQKRLSRNPKDEADGMMRSCPDLSKTNVTRTTAIPADNTSQRLDSVEQRQSGLFKEMSSLNVELTDKINQIRKEQVTVQEKAKRSHGGLLDNISNLRIHIRDQMKQIHADLVREQEKREKEMTDILQAVPNEVSTRIEELESVNIQNEDEIELMKAAVKEQSLEMFTVKEELQIQLLSQLSRLSVLEELAGTDGVFTWRLCSVQQMVKEVEADPCAGIQESPTFYSRQYGYNLKLGLNFPMSVSGTVLGIHPWICLCQGEYDDQLDWPFTGHITFGLVDPSGGGRHLFHHVDSTTDNKPLHWQQPQPGRTQANNAKILYPTFILLNTVKHYLHNDNLYIKVRIS